MLPPRRALLSVSDKAGLAEFARGLAELGRELVSTGGTADALREAGLEVVDVAALSGSDEMLNGRVKTLHPRIHGGILADRTRAAHRAQLAAAAIAPFELVVVNLYPFANAAERPGGLSELVEEIDIGGPAMVRAAAKNFASVAVLTSPQRYQPVLEVLRARGEVPLSTRAALAVQAFRHVAAYDARIVGELPRRMAEELTLPDEPGLPGATDAFPETLPLAFEKVETLRYGENPHQAAALYRPPGATADAGPFALGAEPLQGKQLSYNNVLDAAAVTALARDLRGSACAIVKHTNPCGAAERDDLLAAWRAALDGDPVSAFGGVVAFTREVDGALAEQLAGDLPRGRRRKGLFARRTTHPRRKGQSAPARFRGARPAGRRPGSAGGDAIGRRRRVGQLARRGHRRPGAVAGGDRPRAISRRVPRPRPRLARGATRQVKRHRARA